MKTRSKTRNQIARPKVEDLNSEDSNEYASTLTYLDHNINDVKTDKKRLRKRSEQVKILIEEFNQSPYWSKILVVQLAAKTGLTESQVYKWNWDYRKKLRKNENFPYDSKLVCKETIMPNKLEAEMIALQNFYKLNFSSLPFSTPSRFLSSDL
jgi:Homeodomain